MRIPDFGKTLAFVAFALLGLGQGGAARGAEPDELKLAVIVTRHGVRSPLQKDAALIPYASRPWPQWEVAPGILTPRGNALVGLMGQYYRARYVAAGLLKGDPRSDAAAVYLEADSDQRTIETARTLGAMLLPHAALVIHGKPPGVVDALFQPTRAHLGVPDSAKGQAAVLGRLGGDPNVLTRAYAPQFTLLKGILYPKGSKPVSPNPFDQPGSVGLGEHDNLVQVGGPLRAALIASECLLLEYLDGKPESEVGWGQVDAGTLTQLLTLHDAYFDLVGRTFYPAQVQGSNLASHLLDTLEQAANGRAVPGAIGPPGERLVIVSGHDTNLANLGGLLGLSWWIPGSQANPVLPGSALLFELWHRPGAKGDRLRISYVSQTLEQMRSAEVLSLARPPALAPVYMAQAGGEGAAFEISLEEFARVAHQVIDPQFVLPGAP